MSTRSSGNSPRDAGPMLGPPGHMTGVLRPYLLDAVGEGPGRPGERSPEVSDANARRE
jgi:hypothetical protein